MWGLCTLSFRFIFNQAVLFSYNEVVSAAVELLCITPYLLAILNYKMTIPLIMNHTSGHSRDDQEVGVAQEVKFPENQPRSPR